MLVLAGTGGHCDGGAKGGEDFILLREGIGGGMIPLGLEVYSTLGETSFFDVTSDPSMSEGNGGGATAGGGGEDQPLSVTSKQLSLPFAA